VGTFVTRAAWHDRLEINVHGRPAHAGKEPELGIDAISTAARAISQMRLGRLGPETTANIGLISGGTATNVVPAKVTVLAEARSTDESLVENQIDHMIQCFANAAQSTGAEISVHHHRHYAGYVIDPNSTVVRVAEAASRNLGLSPDHRVTLGGSDGNVYNAVGIPCVVLGTGMDHIHTHAEQITRADLVLTAKMALECLLQSARVR
jgi:tripeptide aminopeptidase